MPIPAPFSETLALALPIRNKSVFNVNALTVAERRQLLGHHF